MLLFLIGLLFCLLYTKQSSTVNFSFKGVFPKQLAFGDQFQYLKWFMEQTTDAIPLVIRDCGLISYEQVLQLQMELCARRQNDEIENTVLIVEHPAVITLGARKSENKLLVNEDEIRHRGIELVQIGRGGGTTAHNPGQLVFYPIIKLKSLRLDVTAYIRSLEQIGIELLKSLGVESSRRKGFPGLWVGEKKIASIGVQLKKWVSFHGMAININNNLSIFDCIVPCGLENVVMTSVQKETGQKADMDAAKRKLTELCLTIWTKKHE